MFNFQKEVVLNNPAEQVRISNVEKDGVVPAKGIDPKMTVHGGGEYFGKYIVEGKVYKTSPVQGVNAKIVLKPAELAANVNGNHIQILIELGLDNDYRGDFGSALWYFRKPILVDLDTTKLTAKDLVKAFNTAIPNEYKFLVVKKDGDNVVLEGSDSCIKVRKVQVLDFICKAQCGDPVEESAVVAAEMAWDKDAKKFVIGQIGEVEENNVEFGTYNYLIHNLRLPTYANLRFTSPSAFEMPMQGTNYVQYSFAYCVPRGYMGGMSVAGQVNHSMTLHTFFVPDTMDSTLDANKHGNKVFEDYLGQILGESFIVPLERKGFADVTILSDAFAVSEDLTASTLNVAEPVKATTSRSKTTVKA